MRLIIGCHCATNELALSDSWGPSYAERWVLVASAQQVGADDSWGMAW